MLERGRRLYGLLNLTFAALYAWIGFELTPSRRLAFPIGVLLVCVLLAGGGVGLLAGARWGRKLAGLACWTLVLGCGVVVGALVASSAYLRGVYGGFGRGAAVVALLVAALVVEVAGLLPLFELRFLRRLAQSERSALASGAPRSGSLAVSDDGRP